MTYFESLKGISLVIGAVVLAIVLGGCREKGPMEKAGEKMDKAVEDVKDAAD